MCYKNQMSNTGRNTSELLCYYKTDSLENLIEKKHMIKKMRVNPLEEGEDWKVKFIEELSLIKKGFLDIDIDMDESEIDRMLDIICTE